MARSEAQLVDPQRTLESLRRLAEPILVALHQSNDVDRVAGLDVVNRVGLFPDCQGALQDVLGLRVARLRLV